MKTNINRCHCSDKKLLPACFAEQHRGRDQALFPYPGLCERQIPIYVTAVTKSCCQPVLQSNTGDRPSTDCQALLQLFSGFPIQACVKGKYQYMSKKAVVSLFCRAAQGKRPSTVCSTADSLVVSLKLLSACFAEQHRGRDQALSVQHCCNSLVVSLSRLV